ncbi:succinylglutamate desuccinylase [Salinimicrobium sp. GXAS 041]|uniref:succinylglutamate desuccinylase n=1 Tax=Salinimicrobium sp. GXAS 041 TaxID=3400806 RepID=UPI003C76F228
MKEELQNIPRVIGKYEGEKGGPLLLVTAGVHGNEPSGVYALKTIFAELEKNNPSIKGTFIGISGNHKALQQGKRFIEEDLNRTWKEKNLKKEEPDSHEQKEMREIIKLLEDYSKEKFSERYFVDCHTTSSDSLPYISVQEVGKNDDFAHKFPGYIVRGFSDIVDGSIDKYFSKQEITGFTFEAGQHTAKTSQANHEAIIWLALKEACMLDLNEVSCYPQCIDTFKDKFEDGQKTFKIVYRHGIEDNSEFKMEPGFENFEKISEGQLLAIQDGKEIKSKWNARIFMPLYQSQGNDGFFVIEEAN